MVTAVGFSSLKMDDLDYLNVIARFHYFWRNKVLFS